MRSMKYSNKFLCIELEKPLIIVDPRNHLASDRLGLVRVLYSEFCLNCLFSSIVINKISLISSIVRVVQKTNELSKIGMKRSLN